MLIILVFLIVLSFLIYTAGAGISGKKYKGDMIFKHTKVSPGLVEDTWEYELCNPDSKKKQKLEDLNAIPEYEFVQGNYASTILYINATFSRTINNGTKGTEEHCFINENTTLEECHMVETTIITPITYYYEDWTLWNDTIKIDKSACIKVKQVAKKDKFYWESNIDMGLQVEIDNETYSAIQDAGLVFANSSYDNKKQIAISWGDSESAPQSRTNETLLINVTDHNGQAIFPCLDDAKMIRDMSCIRFLVNDSNSTFYELPWQLYNRTGANKSYTDANLSALDGKYMKALVYLSTDNNKQITSLYAYYNNNTKVDPPLYPALAFYINFEGEVGNFSNVCSSDSGMLTCNTHDAQQVHTFPNSHSGNIYMSWLINTSGPDGSGYAGTRFEPNGQTNILSLTAEGGTNPVLGYHDGSNWQIFTDVVNITYMYAVNINWSTADANSMDHIAERGTSGEESNISTTSPGGALTRVSIYHARNGAYNNSVDNIVFSQVGHNLYGGLNPINYSVGSEESNNQAPTLSNVSIKSNTGNNVTTDFLNCTNSTFETGDADNDTLSYYYHWYTNGIRNESILDTAVLLNKANTTKDQNWSCAATAFDSTDNSSTVISYNLTILNTAPIITNLTINATTYDNKTNEDLMCRNYTLITSDADNDTLTTYYYHWYTNGIRNESILDTEILLQSTNTSADQNWSCAIIAYDGDDNSSSTMSDNLTIVNSAINITLLTPDGISVASPWNYSFSITDPDNASQSHDCNLTIKDTYGGTNSSTSGQVTIWESAGLGPGTHPWYINCTDGDVVNQTITRNVIIPSPPTGGGSSSSVYTPVGGTLKKTCEDVGGILGPNGTCIMPGNASKISDGIITIEDFGSGLLTFLDKVDYFINSLFDSAQGFAKKIWPSNVQGGLIIIFIALVYILMLVIYGPPGLARAIKERVEDIFYEDENKKSGK